MRQKSNILWIFSRHFFYVILNFRPSFNDYGSLSEVEFYVSIYREIISFKLIFFRQKFKPADVDILFDLYLCDVYISFPDLRLLAVDPDVEGGAVLVLQEVSILPSNLPPLGDDENKVFWNLTLKFCSFRYWGKIFLKIWRRKKIRCSEMYIKMYMYQCPFLSIWPQPWNLDSFNVLRLWWTIVPKKKKKTF